MFLNGSWPLQERIQERFQRSWRPKGSPKGGLEGPKWSPRVDWSSKHDFFKNHGFSMDFNDFRCPGVPFWRSKSMQNRFGLHLECLMPVESLLRAFWSALGGSWSRKNIILSGSWPLWETSTRRCQDELPGAGGRWTEPLGRGFRKARFQRAWRSVCGSWSLFDTGEGGECRGE